MLQNWSQCQVVLMNPSVIKRIREFDVTTLRPETVNRAHAMLTPYRMDHVMENSAGVGAFYAWVRIHGSISVIFVGTLNDM